MTMLPTYVIGDEGSARPWVGAPQRSFNAVYLKAPDAGSTTYDITNAPSRGEGRARPGLDARASSYCEQNALRSKRINR
ncbi:hypothetical protein SAMN04488026_103353 [Aliiruegeria lutimaris]|uniref:Uncharacterized protein n=1 Tax=Aliiruegeria lutimaris TaxID=571298 RepID=A0A1G8ZWI6_9RHOB|nr:hypothetical protein SAMN04488026_103353 [Aliiruegeria lutimaris]